MKNRSYANRGETLETFIELANARYRQKGMAHIEKQNTAFKPLRDRKGKVVSCKVDQKATFDFLGRYKRYPIAIEAKNSNESSIRWDRIETNQARDMDDFCKEPGTIGLVVVCFNREYFYAIPWAFWSQAYAMRVTRADRKTPLTASAFGTSWDIPAKASFREDEIPPEFRVSPNSTAFGLDYLVRAAAYITPYATEEPQQRIYN